MAIASSSYGHEEEGQSDGHEEEGQSETQSDGHDSEQEEESLETFREQMARRVLSQQEATDFLDFILKGAHPYHRALFLVDIGVTQKRAAKLCDISPTTVSSCLKLRSKGDPIVPPRGRPRENMDEPMVWWDTLKEDPDSLPAWQARLLNVRRKLEDESVRHASFHYYVTQFW